MGRTPTGKPTWKDRRSLNKRLKDDEITVITKGRIQGRSNKTVGVALREEFILSRPKMSHTQVSDEIKKYTGEDISPHRVKSIRTILRKQIKAQKVIRN